MMPEISAGPPTRFGENMSSWASEYLTQIEDCEERESKLTEWEHGFIASLREQLENDRRPTAKQIETLDNIWEKATSKG